MSLVDTGITILIILIISAIVYTKVQHQTLTDTVREVISIFKNPTENVR